MNTEEKLKKEFPFLYDELVDYGFLERVVNAFDYLIEHKKDE